MKKIYLSLLACLFAGFCWATEVEETPSDSTASDSVSMILDELQQMWAIDSSFTYQRGEVELGNGMARLVIPKGYKFLDAKQSQYVLSDLWGNPPHDNTMGMLFREEDSPVLGNLYAIEISFIEDGYVDDEDAQDIDYQELLTQMQEDAVEMNKERKKLGYEEVQLVGWASEPFYDATSKKLHWAKELRFEGSEINTLNYNIRILGRKGYLQLNAISEITALDSVNQDLGPILSSVNFNEGHRYSDFNPEYDKVAAYGIGGLIAGKILSKAGFFVVIAKFWKFILIGIVGFFGAIRKFFTGRSKDRREIG